VSSNIIVPEPPAAAPPLLIGQLDNPVRTKPRAYDALTRSAVAYLSSAKVIVEAGRENVPVDSDALDSNEDAFEHLVKICWVFCRAFQLDNPILENKRQFIELWLLKRLRPWLDKSDREIQEAAAGGTFRKLGLQCRSALKDEIERRGAQKRTCKAEISLSEPVGQDENDDPLLVDDFIGIDGPCGSLGHYASLEPAELASNIEEHRGDLKEALGDRLMDTLVAVISAFPETSFVQAIARERGLPVSEAVLAGRELSSKMAKLLKEEHPGAKDLYGLIIRREKPLVVKFV
jgi:hypothetical protein